MQVSFYRSNLFLKVLPKAKGKNEEGNDIQLEAMIDYIWYLLMPCLSGKQNKIMTCSLCTYYCSLTSLLGVSYKLATALCVHGLESA